MRTEQLVGGALILLSVVLALIFWQAHAYASGVVDRFVALGGECTTEEGCLHQEATNWLLIGLAPTAAVLAFGVYVLFFLRVRPVLPPRADPFEILLRGLAEEERAVLRAVRAEEGVTQATLKYRTGFSKSKLSQVLADLEKRGLVRREEHKKTKRVFLAHLSA